MRALRNSQVNDHDLSYAPTTKEGTDSNPNLGEEDPKQNSTNTHTPPAPIIYSTSTATSTSDGYVNFETVVNGHTVDLISSLGSNTVVTVVQDAHGTKTTIAGRVWTIATGDISTVVAGPTATANANSNLSSASPSSKRESLTFVITFIICAVIGLLF